MSVLNGCLEKMPNKLVQARIDRAVTEEAVAVLAAMGLTVSGALRLLLTKIAHEKALPFAPLVPNAATIEAMREARRGNLPQFDSVEDLFDDLHAEDLADQPIQVRFRSGEGRAADCTYHSIPSRRICARNVRSRTESYSIKSTDCAIGIASIAAARRAWSVRTERPVRRGHWPRSRR